MCLSQISFGFRSKKLHYFNAYSPRRFTVSHPFPKAQILCLFVMRLNAGFDFYFSPLPYSFFSLSKENFVQDRKTFIKITFAILVLVFFFFFGPHFSTKQHTITSHIFLCDNKFFFSFPAD